MSTTPHRNDASRDRPPAVLVGIQLQGVSDDVLDRSLAELERLAETLGLRVIGGNRDSRLRSSSTPGYVGYVKPAAPPGSGLGSIRVSTSINGSLKGKRVDLGVWAIWIGIPLCVAQSGIFSGLNLALFGVSALRLEAQSAAGNEDATRLLELRLDSNFLLTTVLWGNVATNVLLTILSESALAGALGFIFSTFVITFGGEILPQAYFSRNALRMATLLRPVLRFWQVLLFPVAKPTAILLDAWLGKESLDFLREDELREVLMRYVAAPTSELGRVEGIGALNFLALDDLRVAEEGESIDPLSLIELPEENGRPIFPRFECTPQDPFIQRVGISGHRWVVITSPLGDPALVLDADGFLRAAILKGGPVRIEAFCHRPIVVEDPGTKIDKVLPLLRSTREQEGDDVIDADLILVWSAEKRVITGADILGRLLRGIARPDS